MTTEAHDEALLMEARRLGFKERYRLGTVLQTPASNLTSVMITLDNDTLPTRCFNYASTNLYANMRVLTIVLEHGVYVIGANTNNGSYPVDGVVDPNTSSTTSATYNNGGSTYGQNFVAPWSGRVHVDFYGRLQMSTISQSGFFSPELKTGAVVGAGTIVVAANDQDATRLQTPTQPLIAKYGQSIRYYGLTPGASYNVEMLVRSTGGGALSVNDRRVMIDPLP